MRGPTASAPTGSFCVSAHVPIKRKKVKALILPSFLQPPHPGQKKKVGFGQVTCSAWLPGAHCTAAERQRCLGWWRTLPKLQPTASRVWKVLRHDCSRPEALKEKERRDECPSTVGVQPDCEDERPAKLGALQEPHSCGGSQGRGGDSVTSTA